jgi:hypothetical protein
VRSFEPFFLTKSKNELLQGALSRGLLISPSSSIDEVAENEWQPLELRAPGKAEFLTAVKDFYLTNPIARASEVMAELSAMAKARADRPMAAE